jgi:hypothetical protein
MKEHFKELHEKKAKAFQELNKIQKALRAMQDLCEHKWVSTGHGHNSEHFNCIHCGEEKEE